MAAEAIAGQGLAVRIYDAMPSVARKFLLAGVGGMNITHGEDYATFLTRYGAAENALRPALDGLPPAQLRAWIHGLGIDTFVGSSGRVFPTDMKAAPLLRAWLHRLRGLGVLFHPRHRWLGWVDDDPARGWRFATPAGERVEAFDAVVLALGGASWPRLGSDGAWCQVLVGASVPVAPLAPSNCGFELPWSAHLRERFAGTPVKHAALSLIDRHGRPWRRKGEFVVSAYGIEGSLVYALSAPLRDLLATGAPATLWLDWLPDTGPREIAERLRQPRGGMSFANLLRKRLRLPPIAGALLRECCPTLDQGDADAVAAALKATPLMPRAPRPIAEAISSAGGVRFDGVDGDLMLSALPGVFIAGEMLDWEAPTGGYLLSACFATGKRAGEGLVRWLAASGSNE
ncbi:MAG: TIGR03862 family flavoprotein [Porticoccaceae bacterium]